MATVEYDDDGVTEAYKREQSVSTIIESNVDKKEPPYRYHSPDCRKL